MQRSMQSISPSHVKTKWNKELVNDTYNWTIASFQIWLVINVNNCRQNKLQHNIHIQLCVLPKNAATTSSNCCQCHQLRTCQHQQQHRLQQPQCWHWHIYYYISIMEFIPGLPFPGRPGFPDIFIPDFPGMKTARFPGKREQRTAVAGPALCCVATLLQRCNCNLHAI